MRWQLVVATNGRGWWTRMCQGLGRHLKRRSIRNHVFHVGECIQNLQVWLSEIQLLVLSMTFHFKRNFSLGWNCAQHTCLVKRDVQKYYFANPNDKIVKTWVMNLQSKFDDDPTVNESKIVILPKYVWVKLEISQFQHRSIKLHIN